MCACRGLGGWVMRGRRRGAGLPRRAPLARPPSAPPTLSNAPAAPLPQTPTHHTPSDDAVIFLNIPMDAETPSMRLLRPQVRGGGGGGGGQGGVGGGPPPPAPSPLHPPSYPPSLPLTHSINQSTGAGAGGGHPPLGDDGGLPHGSGSSTQVGPCPVALLSSLLLAHSGCTLCSKPAHHQRTHPTRGSRPTTPPPRPPTSPPQRPACWTR